jgi:anti-sigma regulatory factor (Ser/Thr protein kinase)
MPILLEIVLPATLENLPVFLEGLTNCARDQGFPPKKISDLELALEEALVNVINYAYPESKGDVSVCCRMDPPNLIIEIIDSGLPFNPLSKDDPDLLLDLDERKIGGYGVFLIKTLIDEVTYQRENNQNILTLIVYPT